MYRQILEKLHSLEEEKYREFSSRLLPNIANVRGIRLPYLQKIAKEISKGDVFEYLQEVTHTFFEETLLMGLVIGNMDRKRYSLEQILSAIRAYIPYINNWSTCDSFCSSLKVTKNEPENMYEFLSIYTVKEDEDHVVLSGKSREYELRFFIVMCLNYYINEAYIDDVLYQFSRIKSSSYYVNMALAWAYSKIYLFFPERIISLLKERIENQRTENQRTENQRTENQRTENQRTENQRIENQRIENQRNDKLNNDVFVHNKTIYKICDSYKVDKQDKEQLRQYLLR